MAKPYFKKTLQRDSFLKKIFSGKNKKNAVIYLNNLLANAESVYEVTPEIVKSVEAHFSVDLAKTFYPELEKLYADFVRYALSDASISGEDVKQMNHLLDVLGISEDSANTILKEETRSFYEKIISKTLKSGKIDDKDFACLSSVAENIYLPENESTKLLSKIAKDHIEKRLKESMRKGEASPETVETLRLLTAKCRVKGVELALNSRKLKSCVEMWQIKHGEIPEVRADIGLSKNEKCYAVRSVVWKETRKVRTGVSYGGVTGRIPIAKGIGIRVGSLSVRPHTQDELVEIDKGRVYITNKRLLFVGEFGAKTIKLEKIIKITPYVDGVDITKDTGKSPFLEFRDEVMTFSHILLRANHEA